MGMKSLETGVGYSKDRWKAQCPQGAWRTRWVWRTTRGAMFGERQEAEGGPGERGGPEEQGVEP